ncbi:MULTISPECIES: helix-turn-helix domain-containing protein [Vibrio]|uniref:helix-turn-helix domain-containing protein n=1 Tax=Vibrio TaxID=662 RepID=UPI000375635D|nr:MULTISPECIES: helix-turn-helix transcriptional regulator [Vibrio]MCC2524186.1 helix-turn-helix domain-containing protein [Vibrio coralliilyticus]MDE3898553.1 helix-turn-helix transcriptional regulator [Vibrio sp. CC007]
MLTTLDLLNQLCEEKQIHSTREVANFLGISHMTVQNWRNGRSMSDDLACEVAVILGLDPDLTLLAIMAERSKNERVIEAVERVTNQKKTA